ncbi:hypothetical protein [Flagellimonas sp. S3867]|uniref:hypothetical protein n=1 Tax=Flagellimonas sp. S3867 TaxID=2768063 RepID=UPI00168A1363|nr:hypothetical protein [Flagellimonas sp. S3867]
MKKLNKAQKFIFISGILLTTFAILGKLDNWDMDFFPFFYTGSTFMWIAFLNTGKGCCWGLRRKSATSKP